MGSRQARSLGRIDAAPYAKCPVTEIGENVARHGDTFGRLRWGEPPGAQPWARGRHRTRADEHGAPSLPTTLRVVASASSGARGGAPAERPVPRWTATPSPQPPGLGRGLPGPLPLPAKTPRPRARGAAWTAGYRPASSPGHRWSEETNALSSQRSDLRCYIP